MSCVTQRCSSPKFEFTNVNAFSYSSCLHNLSTPETFPLMLKTENLIDQEPDGFDPGVSIPYSLVLTTSTPFRSLWSRQSRTKDKHRQSRFSYLHWWAEHRRRWWTWYRSTYEQRLYPPSPFCPNFGNTTISKWTPCPLCVKVLIVVLYVSSTSKAVGTDTQKFQAFINSYLRRAI